VVRLAEVDAERLGSFHEQGDVGVTAQQVVDELGPLRFLMADHVPPLGLVTVDQHADRVVEHPQHRLGSAADLLGVRRADDHGQLPPQSPRRGQVQVHRASGADPLRGRAPSELAHGVELERVGTSAVDRGVRQERQVVPEQLHGCLAGVRCRGRDRGQPVVGGRWPRRRAGMRASLAGGQCALLTPARAEARAAPHVIEPLRRSR
jgi:hypothetical protein